MRKVAELLGIVNTNDYNTLLETFVTEQYLWLVQGLKPHTVAFDIGGHCGDSSIYLAQHKDIDTVFAYDNNEEVFNRARPILQVARAQVREKITYSLAEITNTAHAKSDFAAGEPKLSLKGLLEKEKKKIIIKCDCEGAEHTIFNDDLEKGLRNVYRIQIEYHYGLKGLDKKLKDYGFKVETENRLYDEKLKEVGWLYAWR